MKFYKSVIASLGLAVAGISYPAYAAPGSSVGSVSTATIVATPKTDLSRILRGIKKPTTVLLQPGSYGHVRISDLALPNGTTLQSADMRRPATFEGISLSGIRNLTLSRLSIQPPASGPVAGRYGISVSNSRGIQVDKVGFYGSTRWRDTKANAGIMLRNSSNISVTKSYFTKFQHGIAILNLRDSVVELNEFERLRTDAIRGGGVNNIKIIGNVVTNLEPKRGDHPDGVQLWSTQQREQASRITIADNLVVRGAGDPIQGIFVRDTRLKLPFRDLNISGNLIIGGLYNGITVLGAEGVRLDQNTVLARKDQRSWIRVEHTKDARITRNNANSFVIKNNRAKPYVSNNQESEATNSDLSKAISKWARSKETFATYRGKVLQRLMRSGQ